MLKISAVYVLILILRSQCSPLGVAKIQKEFKVLHTRTLIISVNADSKLKTPDGNKSLLRGHRQGWDFKISHSFQISVINALQFILPLNVYSFDYLNLLFKDASSHLLPFQNIKLSKKCKTFSSFQLSSRAFQLIAS